MGKSKSRDIEFARAKYCTTGASEMVSLMEASLHKKHRVVGDHMRSQLNEMSAKMVEDLKKQEESDKFAKSLQL